MNPAVESLFHDLADLTDQQRLNYYQKHHTEDALRNEVEALITADKSAHTLASPVAESARRAMADLETRQAPARCGPYELKELLGSGGMGSVYRAERDDGEVRIQVAVKLIRFSANDAASQERFLQERQMLASLTHPNIAHLLDAGHLDEGNGKRPYLVMELVEGVPADEWSKGRKAREIVELLLPICDAVSLAHRQLIIHRDLKPGNILVTPAGVPKLLDFGIAKQLNIASNVTQMLFTPGYASPEQVSGGQLTTATDVYSLGAVLYKLLTGNSPHQFAATATNGGIQAAFTQSKPQRPSSVNPECKGDLDSIVLRALRKEPSERYTSVDQMMEDLRAYLESRPVAARRGEAFYQARKFLRRYWIPVTATIAVFASLLIGWIFTQQEKRIAERRFADVRGLAGKFLDVEEKIRNMPESLPVRKQIVDAVVQSLRGLSAEVRNDTGLRIEVARAYRRVAEVQAQRGKSSFGLHQEAFDSLTNAEKLLTTVRRTEPANREAAMEWFATKSALAGRLFDIGKEKESMIMARETADELEKHLASIAVLNEPEELMGIKVYEATARALLNNHLTRDAIHYNLLSTKATAARANRLGTPAAKVMTARSFRTLGTAQRYAGELDAAMVSLQKAEGWLDTAGQNKEGMEERTEIYFYRGMILGETNGLSLGELQQGAHWLHQALQVLRQKVKEDESDVESRLELAEGAFKLGQIQMNTDLNLAVATFEEGIGVLRSAPESNRYVFTYRFRIYLESAVALARLGKHSQAQSYFNKGVSFYPEYKDWPQKAIGPTSPDDSVYRAKAELAAANVRKAEALQLLEDSLKALLANPDFKPSDDLDNANRLWLKLERIGQLQIEAGLPDSHRAERIALWSAWKTKLPENSYITKRLVLATTQPQIKNYK